MSPGWSRAVAGGLSVALAAACGVDAPSPRLLGTDPIVAFDDQPTPLALLGEGFVPRWTLDLGTGHRTLGVEGFTARIGRDGTWLALTDVVWKSPTRIEGTLPPGLPAGAWDVDVVDPRGLGARLVGAFNSVGADATPPDVYFVEPDDGAPIAVGGKRRVSFVAFDPSPGRLAALSWQLEDSSGLGEMGTCDAQLRQADGRTRCQLEITAAATLRAAERVSLRVTATDGAVARNRRDARIDLVVVAPPRLSDFAPRDGSTLGGNDLVLSGSGFLPGTRVFLDDSPLVPGGGVLLNDQTISGRVPAHPPGIVDLRVETPIGEIQWRMAFTYVPPPTLHRVEPPQGSTSGGDPIRIHGAGFTPTTLVLFGDARDEAVPLRSATFESAAEIQGLSPPGTTGETNVWVVDTRFGAQPTPVRFTRVAP